MRVLAVMANYDALGLLPRHVKDQIDDLVGFCDRVVVVSTTEYADERDAEWIRERAELVRRVNIGYDFYGWKTGLDHVGSEVLDYDYVITCNDSYVGPLRPLADIFAEMEDRPLDAWGFNYSLRRSPHIQSFFIAYRPWVVRSRAFHDFWATMEPISDRSQVIARYEIGLSASLRAAGFRLGAVLEENAGDRRIAKLRHWRWAYLRARAEKPGRRLRSFRRFASEPWNPNTALADRALPQGRLPVVKLDTLRYDPYRLGSEGLLRACETRWPERFDEVRSDLEARAEHYRPRRGELTSASPPSWITRRTLGYAK
ncbi:rhamnan synthesis F family protein [uncultured Pseudokineococcus sp.]|uniref:rhamnan synthesis F family protein n=1 Tax=uncultured Pseudokineococcus sp. TaxID=1642928 RepID=UPI002632350E|nr:rhamnan synthesis F family protein [uncultured Pseudokineococcus sp.]